MVDRDEKRAVRARIQKATKDPDQIQIARAFATQWGYHRFDILVVHTDTGEVIESIPTARKPENIVQLLKEIREVASLPKELWAKIKHKSPELGETDVQKVLDGQCLGGRPPGMHSKTAKKHRALASLFYKSTLTQREFCRETGVKRSTLQRALKFVSKYGLEDY